MLYDKDIDGDKYDDNSSTDTNKDGKIEKKEFLDGRYVKLYNEGKVQRENLFKNCKYKTGNNRSGKSIIRLVRKWEYDAGTNSNSSTVGTFTIDDDTLTGYIMEPYGKSTTESGKDKRIPAGEYSLQWYTSDKFTKDKYGAKGTANYLDNGFPNLYNDSVSGTRGILIHVGNYGKDTTGCLLPGNNITTTSINNKKYVTAVLDSTVQFFKLIDYIETKGIENVKIIITEDYEDYNE